MESVIYPTEEFNFSGMNLGQPSTIQGGSYFTKLTNNSNPILLQTPRCFTKQGIVVAGKKAYCDIMFSNEDTAVISWFEKLLDTVQNRIYDKRNLWFHNEMDKDDIDDAFTSPIRTYRSGKNYLVRTYLQGTNLNGFKCYDENELNVDHTTLNENNPIIIPLLEIKGVKFSSKSFQFDIILRQVMVMENINLSTSCLIKPSTQHANIKEEHIVSANIHDERIVSENAEEEPIVSENTTNTVMNVVDATNSTNIENNEDAVVDNASLLSDYTENDSIHLSLEEVNIDINDIEEISSNKFSIKPQNQVYIELWKDARKKAKQARNAAIEAYLEAKKIRTNHMLEDLLDDDSEDEYFDEYVEGLEN